jgi:hypothetical protein
MDRESWGLRRCVDRRESSTRLDGLMRLKFLVRELGCVRQRRFTSRRLSTNPGVQTLVVLPPILDALELTDDLVYGKLHKLQILLHFTLVRRRFLL